MTPPRGPITPMAAQTSWRWIRNPFDKPSPKCFQIVSTNHTAQIHNTITLGNLVRLRIGKLCLAKSLRSHPLTKHVLWASGRYVKRHRASMKSRYSDRTASRTSVQSGSGPNGARIHRPNPPSKPAALEAATWIQADVRVYSDGSGMDGDIGAATVLHRNGEM